MDHFRAKEALTDLPHNAHFCPGRQRVLLARIEIEEPHCHPTAAVVYFRNELASRTKLYGGLNHRTLNLHGLAGNSVVDGDDARLVLVTQWQMRDQIRQLMDAYLGQLGADRRRGKLK